MNTGRQEAGVEVYDALYDGDSIYNKHYTKSFYHPMMRVTLNEVVRLGGHSIVEVGCGGGAFAQMVLDRTRLSYRGFDFSPAGVRRAIERIGRQDIFAVADARDPASYRQPYDTIVCTEVLEHISADRDVISLWQPGSRCVCSVPNFDHAEHVRFFRHEDQVRHRYGDLISIDRIIRVPRPLMLGRSFGDYLLQLRWNRDKPARFFALLGFRTFDNLAGWFVFSGIRRPQ